VAVEARKAAQATQADPGPTARPGDVPTGVPPVTLTERRLAARPADTRPLPSVAAYDQLLRRPPPALPPS